MNNIESEVKLKLITEVDMISIGNSACSICLNPFSKGAEVVFLFCSHIYHFGCIDRWFAEVRSLEFQLSLLQKRNRQAENFGRKTEGLHH